MEGVQQALALFGTSYLPSLRSGNSDVHLGSRSPGFRDSGLGPGNRACFPRLGFLSPRFDALGAWSSGL